ncbi:unnamed protein product [Protopolystoma xenopodis]|uniref:Uncharacterized protein n=1 Tax=Protopolystoma xenopodis TaxID=117903 RepID=A0A448X805_9PLAT|nr:unnamed protein product [Protopolystoma xenopodis]
MRPLGLRDAYLHHRLANSSRASRHLIADTGLAGAPPYCGYCAAAAAGDDDDDGDNDDDAGTASGYGARMEEAGSCEEAKWSSLRPDL